MLPLLMFMDSRVHGNDEFAGSGYMHAVLNDTPCCQATDTRTGMALCTTIPVIGSMP